MKVAVIIPCYKVKKHILGVISSLPPVVDKIYIVDDACPEKSGQHVSDHSKDPRVEVILHSQNLGVGGATMTGYKKAIQEGFQILVKMDGDGQMQPDGIHLLIEPIKRGMADYTKGNRFFSLEHLKGMPTFRLIGNAGLSFITKVSSGYWNLMDPTNGFTALHASAAAILPFDKIDNRYFFESDLLFRLNTLRAVVMEVPLPAVYGDEESSLNIGRTLFTFPQKHVVRFLKRLFYNYILRDFNIASIQGILGTLLILLGVGFGLDAWISNAVANEFASAGTVMLAALPLVIGFQMILAAISFDVNNVPSVPLQSLVSGGAYIK